MNATQIPATAQGADRKEIDALLTEARSRGVILWATDGQLHYRAPEGAMTAALRAGLKEHKSAIVAALGNAAPVHAAPVSKPQFHPRPPCRRMPIVCYHRSRWQSSRSGASGLTFTNATQMVLHVEGPLNVPALQESIRYLLRRHTILTARVAETADGAEFVFDQENNITLQVIDLSDTAADTRVPEARRIARDQIWTPFSMDAAAPLMRIFTIRLSEHEHLVGYVIHHFICDGWSVLNFTTELARAYTAFSAGTQPDLPELPVQYSDYVAGMNEWIQSGRAEESATYWRNHLRGAPPTRVPPDTLLEPEATGEVAISWIRLSPEVVAQIRNISKSRRIWMQSIVLAAMAAALAHCSNSRDIVIVSRTHGRTQALLFGLVGAFFDATAVRVSVSMQMSFDALTDQIQQTLTQACVHEAYPYQLLKDSSSLIGASDISVWINFFDETNVPGEHLLFPRSRIFDLGPSPQVVQSARASPGSYTLVGIGPQGMNVITEYLSLAYRAETIARYGEVMCRLLQKATQDSARTLSSMLTG